MVEVIGRWNKRAVSIMTSLMPLNILNILTYPSVQTNVPFLEKKELFTTFIFTHVALRIKHCLKEINKENQEEWKNEK